MGIVNSILQRVAGIWKSEGLSVAEAIARFESYRTPNHQYHLPGLDVTVALQPTECIMDCGVVESIADHTRALLQEWNSPTDDNYVFEKMGLPGHWRNRRATGGSCLIEGFPEGRVLAVLRYVPTGDPVLDQMTQGHEETHALQHLNQVTVLESLVNNIRSAKGDIPCDFSLLSTEAVAQIGGLVSLHRHGYDPHTHRERILQRLPPGYQSATTHAYQVLPRTASIH